MLFLLLMVVIVISHRDEFAWEDGRSSETRSRVEPDVRLVSPTSSTEGRSVLPAPATPLFAASPGHPPSSQRTTREMSWMSTDMSATTNTDKDGNSSEMSYTSSLQYLNSQLVAHGFAHNPGIFLDGLSSANMESAVKVFLSLLNQRVVRFFLLFSRFWGVHVD